MSLYAVAMYLFPAQAGVILPGGLFDGMEDTVPRASGGDPPPCAPNNDLTGCSPRKRG